MVCKEYREGYAAGPEVEKALKQYKSASELES